MNAAGDGAPLLSARALGRDFDVSKPWLNRVLERQPRQILRAVDGVDIDIARGRTFSLVGESGCGKSTVARLVVGLHRPSRGSVHFDGVELSALSTHSQLAPFRQRIQMIFQDPYASLNPRWRVRDIVAEPLRQFGLTRGHEHTRRRVDELLGQVGLASADGDKYPHEFSGGQRQRISIARALSSEPEFLVCDEPTSALDVSVQAQILNLMKDLQRRLGLTYLFISHNLAVVRYISDQVGVMYLGKLCEVADAEELFEHPRHPYTRLLLDTIPDLSMSDRERRPVGGEVPNPIDPPSGCAFHPRCPLADERCRRQTPELLTAGPSRRGDEQPGATRVACHAVEEQRVP